MLKVMAYLSRVITKPPSLSKWCILFIHPYTNSVLNTSKLFLTCSICYWIKIILLDWWKDNCIASLHTYALFSPSLFESSPVHRNPSSSSELHPAAKVPWNTCMLLITAFHLECLFLEKLINPSLMLLTLLNVVQHSKHNINQGAKQYDTAPQRGRNS